MGSREEGQARGWIYYLIVRSGISVGNAQWLQLLMISHQQQWNTERAVTADYWMRYCKRVAKKKKKRQRVWNGQRDTEKEAESKKSDQATGKSPRCTAEAFWKWMQGPSAAYRLEGCRLRAERRSLWLFWIKIEVLHNWFIKINHEYAPAWDVNI